MSKFTAALNEQVASEFAASQQYVAIAVSIRRARRCLSLPDILPAGGRRAKPRDDDRAVPARCGRAVTIPGVAAPQSGFEDERRRSSWRWAREDGHRADRRLVQLAREEYEHVGEQFLGWFLAEQREEVASMAELLSVIDRAGAENMLLVEDYLARVGASAAEPTAPPRQQPEAPFSVALAPLSYSAP